MRDLSVTPVPGYHAEIGRSVWALEEERGRLKKAVADLTQEQLDSSRPMQPG